MSVFTRCAINKSSILHSPFYLTLLFTLYRGFGRNEVIHTGILYMVFTILFFILIFLFIDVRFKFTWLRSIIFSFNILLFLIYSCSMIYHQTPFTNSSASYLYSFVIVFFGSFLRFNARLVSFKYIPHLFIAYAIHNVYSLFTLTDLIFDRFRGVLPSVNQFGINSSIAFAISFTNFLLSFSFSSKIINLVLSGVYFLFLILSGSRGALTCTGLFFAVFFFFNFSLLKSLPTYLKSLLFVILFGFLYLLRDILYRRIIEPFFFGSPDSASHNERLQFFTQFFDDSSWSLDWLFFGDGINNFSIHGGPNMYPHNFFLEMASDLGLFFAISFLVFMLIILLVVYNYLCISTSYDFKIWIFFSLFFLISASTLYTSQASLTVQFPILLLFLVDYIDSEPLLD